MILSLLAHAFFVSMYKWKYKNINNNVNKSKPIYPHMHSNLAF